MKVQAGVLWQRGEVWKVEEVELGDPKPGEVLVRIAASGICHSDDHSVTGDVLTPLPLVGGHEGAGTVVAIGDKVSRVSVGDHVILTAIPSCGNCRWCSSGHANLCDKGAAAMTVETYDGTVRRHIGETPISAMCQLGTFSDHVVVSEMQTVPIDTDIPLDVAALIGCGVTTGLQAATKVGEVRPGDVVVVQGVGGVGTNAVQGARIAGASTIVAVDPVEAKREWAVQFGATDAAASMEEATELVSSVTRNVMADKAILCVSVAHGEHLGPLLRIISKGGRVVITSVAPMTEEGMSGSLFELAMMDKEVRGHVYGRCNPMADIPRTLALYRSGQLKLDELITTRYKLADVNDGFAAMHGGTNLRGLIEFD
jgi:NDMA-dependent alcohol dehydrogenase